MPVSADSSAAAARALRLAQAYNPELFRAAAHRWSTQLADHLAELQQRTGPVTDWHHPAVQVAEVEALLAQPLPPLTDDAAVAMRFTELLAKLLDRGMHLHHPRYIGHQVPPPVPIAALFDAAGSVANHVMAIYEMGPWCTAVEEVLIDRLGQQIGWPSEQFGGLVTHGGSAANLTALLTARNVVLAGSWEQGLPAGPRPVLVVQADAHYCIARSAGILGLGTQQIVKAELDGRRRMDPERLDATLTRLRQANTPIVAVAACACATPIGAFDPLEEVAAVCQKHDVWLHVDAAHGGAALFSRKYRHRVAGLELADSLIWDAHKMLYVPALCAFVFYRNKSHRYLAFQQEAPYLFDPAAPEIADYDSGRRTLECTKRAATYGLWGLWSLFGPELFGDLVDTTFDLAFSLYERLSDAPDFDALHEPQCNIVAFRHVPAALQDAPPEQLGRFQLTLRRKLLETGNYYVVPTSYAGVPALRCTVMNPLTTHSDLAGLLTEIRTVGQQLLR